jgi:hypothetical protein
MATTHTVRSGECISSIAFEYGFFPETLWNHPDNSELKGRRHDPNVLLEGDEVRVPDLRVKREDCATEARHRFRRRGVPEKLRVRIEDDEGKPLANVPYEITIDGTHRRGTTDAEGWVIECIPPDAQGGTLLVGVNGQRQKHELKLGHLDPIDQLSGVAQRLRNLGYDPGAVNGHLTEHAREAVRRFQMDRSMEATGEADDATRQRLVQDHHS